MHPDYHLGDNELGTWELSLASAYENLGRSDLADCVRSGKKFQRLRDLLETDNLEPSRMYALYRAFIKTNTALDEPEPQSVAELARFAERDFPDLALPDENLNVLRYRAAQATYLPGIRLPEDSDSENEGDPEVESDWDSVSSRSREEPETCCMDGEESANPENPAPTSHGAKEVA